MDRSDTHHCDSDDKHEIEDQHDNFSLFDLTILMPRFRKLLHATTAELIRNWGTNGSVKFGEFVQVVVN